MRFHTNKISRHKIINFPQHQQIIHVFLLLSHQFKAARMLWSCRLELISMLLDCGYFTQTFLEVPSDILMMFKPGCGVLNCRPSTLKRATSRASVAASTSSTAVLM